MAPTSVSNLGSLKSVRVHPREESISATSEKSREGTACLKVEALDT